MRMKIHLRRKLGDTRPVSINVHNLVLKLRKIRYEVYLMKDLVDSALERIDEPGPVNSGDHFPP